MLVESMVLLKRPSSSSVAEYWTEKSKKPKEEPSFCTKKNSTPNCSVSSMAEAVTKGTWLAKRFDSNQFSAALSVAPLQSNSSDQPLRQDR